MFILLALFYAVRSMYEADRLTSLVLLNLALTMLLLGRRRT